MANVSVQDLNLLEGVEAVYSAADGAGDTIVAEQGDSKLLLHIKNGDAAAHTVTVDDVNSRAPVGGQTFDPDVQVSVPAGAEVMAVLGQLGRFQNDAGNISLSWSAVTGMTFAVLRVR